MGLPRPRLGAVRKLALEVIADRLDDGEDVFTGHPEETPAEPAPFSIEITPVAVARSQADEGDEAW